MAAVPERVTPEPSTADLATVFARTERRLGLFLAQMVRDRALADDLLQDTFHDVLRSGVDVPKVRNVEAWLFGIARNRALAALRRRRRLAHALERVRAQAQGAHEEDDVVAVRDLLERHLTPDERALLVLRFLHGFDSNELGVILGCKPDAARQRIARARAKLIRAAEGEGRHEED